MKIASIFTFFTIIFCGCTKESANPGPLQVIKLENVHFATAATTSVAPPYTPYACVKIINDSTSVPGTICKDTKGGGCSVLQINCTPLPSDAVSGLYTQKEIDEKINLIEKAYGIKYTY